METSLFLAQVIGLMLVLMGLAVLARRRSMSALVAELTANSPLLFFTGIIATIIGLLLVLSHNIWEMNYRGVITFFGWVILLKGIIRLWWPEKVAAMVARFHSPKLYSTFSIIAIVIGLWLASIGFGA